MVVNISSPNTPGLRSLQRKSELRSLLAHVAECRDECRAGLPLLVKIAPDLSAQEKKDIAQVCLDVDIQGIVVSNTTVSRPDSLKSANPGETGGLSGAPCRSLARTQSVAVPPC